MSVIEPKLASACVTVGELDPSVEVILMFSDDSSGGYDRAVDVFGVVARDLHVLVGAATDVEKTHSFHEHGVWLIGISRFNLKRFDPTDIGELANVVGCGCIGPTVGLGKV